MDLISSFSRPKKPAKIPLSFDIYRHHKEEVLKTHNQSHILRQQPAGISTTLISDHQTVTASPIGLPQKFQDLIDKARMSPNRSLIKLESTAKKSAMGTSTVWRDVSRRTFVPPIRISSRSVAWIEVEVDALLAAKALISRSGATVDIADFVSALIAP